MGAGSVCMSVCVRACVPRPLLSAWTDPAAPQKHFHSRVVSLRPRRSSGWLLAGTRWTGPLATGAWARGLGAAAADQYRYLWGRPHIGWEDTLGKENLNLSYQVSSEEAFVLFLLHLFMKPQKFHSLIFSSYPPWFSSQNCCPPFISSFELMTPARYAP